MAAQTPAQQAAVERLRAWALSPQGRAEIGLDGAHPMTACMRFYRGKMPGRMIGGWCYRLVLAATGRAPGRGGA